MNALLVKDEALRNEALAQYEVLNTAQDPVLDDIARLAAQLCSTPVALIVLVGSDRLWLKSHIGINSTELSRSAPCPAKPPSSATLFTRCPTRGSIPISLLMASTSKNAPIASMQPHR